MFEYHCPECETAVTSPAEAKPGQKFRCPECKNAFVPRAEVILFADDGPKPKPASAKPTKAAPKPTATKTSKPAPAPKPESKPPKDDDQDDDTPYGVIKESEEEKKLAEKNKPVFGAVKDKFKRSARGPASALLVLPSNLLIGQGAITIVAGILLMVFGAWSLVFTDVPTSDEELAEQSLLIFCGIVALSWGGIQCYGASQMQNLENYSWALVASVFGFLPLLAGIFSIMSLRDPRVIAGFEEPESGPKQNDDEDDEDEDDEDEDDEDEDDEEEEEERPRKRKK